MIDHGNQCVVNSMSYFVHISACFSWSLSIKIDLMTLWQTLSTSKFSL